MRDIEKKNLQKKSCLHCSEHFLAIDNALDKFCCFGCKSAYLLINGLNLSKYYEYCKKLYDKSPMKVNDIVNELDYLEHVTQTKNRKKIFLLIEGIHCGACVWLIENTLKKQDKVVNARVNLSTKRLTLEWLGDSKYIYELISILEKIGYRAIPFTNEDLNLEQKKNENHLLKCMVVAGIASIQVMMLVMGIWTADDSMGSYTRSILHLVAMIIAIPAVIYSGMPFFKSACAALKVKRSNMDVPISIGVISSTIISIQETINGGAHTYYDAAISLLFVLLIGRYLDLRIRNKARREAHNLILSQPRSVTIYEGEKLKLIDIKKAKIGQIALISSGERIPVDGAIIEGESEVDNSIISGETFAIKVKPNSEVFAGSINLGDAIKVKITHSSDNNTLSEIIKLIENAEQGRAKYVTIAEKIASYYTPFVLTASILTFCFWKFIFAISLSQALLNAVAVLIVTCPCALALSVPIVQIVASLKLMKEGILIKTADALERIVQVDAIAFDKTGTITEGKPQFINKNDFSKEEMKIIASMANKSKHVLLTPIKELYHDELYDFEVIEEKGRGLKANWQGEEIRLGNRIWCELYEKEIKDEEDSDGYLEIWFKFNKKIKRLILNDKVRQDAIATIKSLKRMRFDSILMLSGDRTKAVKRIAHQIDIDYYESMLKPQDKYNKIRELQKKRKVLMIGDGLNDSIALKEAYASVSVSSGLAIAQDNADVIIQKGLFSVIEILSIAKKSEKLVKQNIMLSLFYNLVTIPIAMLGLITPLIAAVAMATSSILVILNAMRLNTTQSEQ